jgi:transposase
MNYLGLDIAKATFDAYLYSSFGQFHATFSNDQAGFEKLKAWLDRHLALSGELVHACMEATGNWGLDLAAFLVAAGLTVSIVNPRQIKAFGESELARNKTDKFDAALIARFCRAHDPAPWTPPAADLREFREMVRRCASLKVMRTQEINRSKAGFVSAAVADSIKQMIEYFDNQIATLTKEIRQLLKKHDAMKKDFDLLLSIPGIGEVTAAILLAELPNITEFKPKALAAFAGISPQERSSGTQKGASRICRTGNPALRTALFMAALSAKQHNPIMVQFANRLRAAGKPKKVILIAIARKLLVLAHAVLRTKKPFTAEALV